MNFKGVIGRRHVRMGVHVLTDATLFVLGFGVGFLIRLGVEESKLKFLTTLPGILAAAFVFVCTAYLTGLYDWSPRRAGARRISALGVSLSVTAAVMVVMFYAVGSSGVGRGVFALGAISAFLFCLTHHLSVLRKNVCQRERAAILVGGPHDERRVLELGKFWGAHFDFVGLVHTDTYPCDHGLKALGSVRELIGIIARERIQRIICTDEALRVRRSPFVRPKNGLP